MIVFNVEWEQIKELSCLIKEEFLNGKSLREKDANEGLRCVRVKVDEAGKEPMVARVIWNLLASLVHARWSNLSGGWPCFVR